MRTWPINYKRSNGITIGTSTKVLSVKYLTNESFLVVSTCTWVFYMDLWTRLKAFRNVVANIANLSFHLLLLTTYIRPLALSRYTLTFYLSPIFIYIYWKILFIFFVIHQIFPFTLYLLPYHCSINKNADEIYSRIWHEVCSMYVWMYL